MAQRDPTPSEPGGIRPFLSQYLRECLTIGYPAAPMEQEAVVAVSRLVIGGLA